MTIEEKYARLIEIIKEHSGAARSSATHGGAAVAFSGGVDSSFLCRAAIEALGKKAIAITIVSPMLPKTEIDCAKKVAERVGIDHILVENPEIEEQVAANPKDRCYHCKKIEFGTILAAAKERGVSVVLDGSNTDDLSDYRPGLQALEELHIVSPLREAGLNKAEIRELSRRLGLPTWNKPAYACLASRIPYGERIDAEKLSRVEKAESCLSTFGFREFRVRAHGDIARIEVAKGERARFFNEETLDAVSREIKACGYLYVAFELEGYSVGSLNRALGISATPSQKGAANENTTL